VRLPHLAGRPVSDVGCAREAIDVGGVPAGAALRARQRRPELARKMRAVPEPACGWQAVAGIGERDAGGFGVGLRDDRDRSERSVCVGPPVSCGPTRTDVGCVREANDVGGVPAGAALRARQRRPEMARKMRADPEPACGWQAVAGIGERDAGGSGSRHAGCGRSRSRLAGGSRRSRGTRNGSRVRRLGFVGLIERQDERGGDDDRREIGPPREIQRVALRQR
jgi:hypothetical protein